MRSISATRCRCSTGNSGIEPPDGAIHDRLREHLAQRGASFFRDLYVAAEGGDPTAVLEAVWDLVWSGEVTNDTLAPLRAFLGSRRSRKPRRPTVSGATPPAGSGRWYLTGDLLAGVPALPEVQAKARAEQLLERHGVVTRDAVLSEGQPGGFAGLYPVLAAMEDAGRTRRGYFIEGLGGAQFGQPGAIDRLRRSRRSDHGCPRRRRPRQPVRRHTGVARPRDGATGSPHGSSRDPSLRRTRRLR